MKHENVTSGRPAAGYVRCSTDNQEMSIPDQKRDITSWAATNGFRIDLWFEDEGKSGTTAKKRPGFMQLIQRVETNNSGFGTVICYSVNRFGRFADPADTIYYLQRIKHRGVQIRFVNNEATNVDDFSGRMNLLMEGETASKFSRDQSLVVLRGSKSNAARGYSSGGLPPYGYAREVFDPQTNTSNPLTAGEHKNIKTHRVRFALGNKDEIATVRRIFDLRGNQGLGYRKIAEILNRDNIPSPRGGKWGKNYIAHLLGNPSYIGQRVYNKISKGTFNGGGELPRFSGHIEKIGFYFSGRMCRNVREET